MHGTVTRLQRAARSNRRFVMFTPAVTAVHFGAAALFYLGWCTWAAQALAACHLLVFAFVATWPCAHALVLHRSRSAHMACTVAFALLAAPPAPKVQPQGAVGSEVEERPPPLVPVRRDVFSTCAS